MTPAVVLTHRMQSPIPGQAAPMAATLDCAASMGGEPSRGGVRDGIHYANVEAALAAAGAAEMKMPDCVPAAQPGFIRIGTDEQVLAIGLDAHLALADWQKCTLIAEALDLEAIGGSGDTEPSGGTVLNSLLWSCINTRRAVILGRRAWSAAQLLPFADLRFHATPPLRWIEADGVLDRNRILIIDHEKAGTVADAMAASLSSYARVDVLSGWTLGGSRAAEMVDLRAGVHLHVGEHRLSDDTVRLVDSWINRVPALHVRPRRALQHRLPGDDTLSVRHARNGFECADVAEALAAYEDLRGDRALRRKLTEEGMRAATPLAEGWKAIAAELLEA